MDSEYYAKNLLKNEDFRKLILENVILDNRSEDEYIEWLASNITFDMSPNITCGWILNNGQIIGFTDRYRSMDILHIQLAYIFCAWSGFCDWETAKYNPVQYLEEMGSIKFCTEYAMTYKYNWIDELKNKSTLQKAQEDVFKEWLKTADIPVIQLGEDQFNTYSRYAINQMDSLMLFKHLIS